MVTRKGKEISEGNTACQHFNKTLLGFSLCLSIYTFSLGKYEGCVEELTPKLTLGDQPTNSIPMPHISLVPDVCDAGASEFDSIYKNQNWVLDNETRTPMDLSRFYNNAAWPPKQVFSQSGAGSDLGYNTETSMKVLRESIQKYNITSMVDIPCGDVNWIFDSVETDRLPVYIGLDITRSIVDFDKARFEYHSNKIFLHWDGAKCRLPQVSKDGAKSAPADLIHVRDVLQHLPTELALNFLCNILSSGIRILVTTSYSTQRNREVKAGGFYKNNLMKAPFDLPKPVSSVPTHPTHEKDDTIVYELDQPWVAEWIGKKGCSARLQKFQGN
jgi:hypothetical protein